MKKLAELTRSAPMSGAPTPGGNAPQKAQRRSVRAARTAPVTPAAQPPAPAAPSLLPPNVVWAQIASTPGASPLVLELARKAQGGF